ncbi:MULTISPECIES: hypothetical protein [unclassified Frigoribacterium]|uniref:hypothetical protein n=1 Tax=unclassified Frigoribacterium TaxID=2627005 RepID=UPI001563B585|nr:MULTISPECIES: hypothetical protein [unclassified Frigoribacterium]NQW86122.1 hypothetical protein [Frigoribacterium sp. VKM Ac-2860]NQX07454.1 hypothetical protein [Frigoribacterium sp. VKM Ac-2859]
MSDSREAGAGAGSVAGLATPFAPLTMLGAPDAVACEGDSCLVVPPVAEGTSTVAEPGRRGVSR